MSEEENISSEDEEKGFYLVSLTGTMYDDAYEIEESLTVAFKDKEEFKNVEQQKYALENFFEHTIQDYRPRLTLWDELISIDPLGYDRNGSYDVIYKEDYY